MGVSLESYRLQIGCFAAVVASLTKHRLSRRTAHGGRKFPTCNLKILPLFVCALLLIIAGVESNPGPNVRSCCGKTLNTVKGYLAHVRSDSKHFSDGKKQPCAYAHCVSVFSSVGSLGTHISTTHRSDKIEHFQCPVVNCLDTSDTSFQAHLENHLDNGQYFNCPFEKCSEVHKNKSSFKSHMSRFHSGQQDSSDRSPSEPEFSSICDAVPSAASSGKRPSLHVAQAESLQSEPAFKKIKTSASVSDIQSVPGPSSIQSTPMQVCNLSDSSAASNVSIQDKILRFYLDLEGKHIIPSSTVQIISESIKDFSEISHEQLKEATRKEMIAAGIDPKTAEVIISKSFTTDPIFNTHHKHAGSCAMTSTHLRKELMKKKCPYVPGDELCLGLDQMGNRRLAHYVSVRLMLEVLLKDDALVQELLKSFSREFNESPELFEDFTDGSAFRDHRQKCKKKNCITLIFFQDGFEFNPFGPAKGLYKSLGFYYIIGNLPKEYRSKVSMILLALLLPEKNLKPTEEEFLQGKNMLEEPLSKLISDLTDLNENGILINNEKFPVCALFFTGDNLGSNQVACLVQSFTAKYCCRVCPLSMDDFKKNPTECVSVRTPQHYEECVAKARECFHQEKEKALENHAKRVARLDKTGGKKKSEDLFKKISKSAYQDLKSIHHLGVKYYSSPLNKIPGFHVCSSTMPPCLAHDLFQGIVALDMAKILEDLIEKKQWFSLEVLNRRIRHFKYVDSDAADAPGEIKSFDSLKNHAIENWNLIRLFPLIVADLVKDPKDPMWLLLLQLKEICEFVCAPRISRPQVLYLSSLISSYLSSLKLYLPACLTPKHHFLMHYPELIFIYGPLINLFTMRFESNHVFFKSVGKACRNFQNITSTLVSKYQYRFASEHTDRVLPVSVEYTSRKSSTSLPSDVEAMLPSELSNKTVSTSEQISVKGTMYKVGQWVVLNKADINDLCFGCIETIYIFPDDIIYFKLRQHVAENTYRGFYTLSDNSLGTSLKNVVDLPDFYPLPAYSVMGKKCLSLKHSNIFM